LACTNCGTCCAYVQIGVRAETARWLELHGLPTVQDNGTWQLRFDTPCEWRDEERGVCTDYENRPAVCRDYYCKNARPEGNRMGLTREALEERRAAMQADMAALAGALQQLDWTLAQMDEPEPEAETDEETTE
jgi:Fe-S-cluster containining protein